MSGLPHAQAIANRLSLRAPQREALEILARVCDRIALSKEQDLDGALRAVQAERPEFAGFDDRQFPSLCFALATGVGKTRLMGAFIAWLHRAHGVNDFLVLAPNLTIYQKLITDFTPNMPKYVFQGVSEFATNPPEIVTGDNFESGHGVRKGKLFDSGVYVNVFNIAKIHAESRGDRQPRVKTLIETIGEPYFDYLAGLERLVMLMDESHRYRATAGVRAINELRPVLGLELTATPQVETARDPQPFGNVVYSYPLANAIADGFVKEPAVATRQDFDVRSYDAPRLERLKLEDGVRIHESTKVDLEVYSRNQGLKRVKPFVLVVARDTEHAGDLQRTVEADDFFGGRYHGKVITVHSKQGREERDEVVQLLLSVEDPENPIEIVIHVNMLKEGWDVTNLFTIVPLRTADSKTLVEQSIGRGLRLPYGKRTGVAAVDRLTIVAHDRFQEIVDYANDPNSLVRRMSVVYIDRELGSGVSSIVEVQPSVVGRLIGADTVDSGEAEGQQHALFDTPRKQEVARLVLDALPEFERLPSSRDLLQPEVQAKIVDRVREALPPVQGDFTQEDLDLDAVVRATVETYVELSIDIPRVLVQPKSEVHGRYRAFQLDLRNVRLQPVTKDILIRHLQDNRQYLLVSGDGVVPEARPENYVVRGLVNFDDVGYDENAEVLYSLAEQVVRHLRSYLPGEDDVSNVLQYHQRALAEMVHVQMQEHYEEPGVEYEVVVNSGFTTLRPASYSLRADDSVRGFREPVAQLQQIPQMLFGGFEKSVYPVQRFQSDPERRFAGVLEGDASVLKWLKPQAGQIHISRRDGGSHLPDFVVETQDRKFLCEVKRRDQIEDPEVLDKAGAGARWCEGATSHAKKHGAKPWAYALVPDDEIGPQRSFAGLVAAHLFRP